MKPAEAALPKSLRFVTMAGIGLGLVVSWLSWAESAQVLMVESAAHQELQLGPFESSISDTQKALMKVSYRAQLAAIESMRGPRASLLVALSFAAMVTGVFCLRVRWPGRGSRGAALKLVTFTALAAAVLRAMDGGQELVIARKAAAAVERDAPALPGVNSGDLVGMLTVAAIAKAFFVVACFVGLWSYFRSKSVRDAVDRADASLHQ